MFDLPTDTALERQHYRWFRKFLISEGFVMMQESIYTKIIINQNAANVVSANVKRHSPSSGLVQLMVVTEKQFARMEYICGTENQTYIQNDERLIVI
jgi:CRISPR-associated protein Cas2